MSGPVTVASPAKINLLLGVGPLRPDGFHTLATVYQAIGLYDEVTVTRAATTTLTVAGEDVDVAEVPTGESNLALRAAAALASHAGLPASEAHVAMHVRKRIPVAGGMAGGSTDAAAALLACDTLWALGTPREDLLALAAGLGSDVPFCLVGGTATGAGRGEVVDSVEDNGTYWWVVVPSSRGLSTPAVFAELDRLRAGTEVPEPRLSEELLGALAAGDARRLAGLLANDLTEPALALRPDLAAALDLGGRPPALAGLLSGSGPTCLVLAPDEAQARRIAATLADAGTAALVARGPVPGAHVVPGL
jgi:4-diphosphocytidyl-2-C-methyl-D-erythritol kinase